MKKLTLFLSLFALSFVLAACGNNSNNATKEDEPVVEDSGIEATENNEIEDNNQETTDTTDTTETDQSEQPNSGSDDEVAKMEKLDYVEFELEVEYAGDKEYEAELELKSDQRVKAEIEDELKGVEVKGPKAFEQLYPLVEQLTITPDTPKEEAIQEVLQVFELDAGYEEFEVEITFKDGTKIEFKDRK